MTELEIAKLKVKCMEMVEGTNLKWWNVLKFRLVYNIWEILHSEPKFNWGADDYKLAIAVVEGKPVWEGDTLYFNGEKCTIKQTTRALCSMHLWSWNPPQPKTLTIELPIADIRYWGSYPNQVHPESARLYEACCNAVRRLKNGNENVK